MEANGHDSICRVKSLFDTVSVVNIDIDVDDSLVIPDLSARRTGQVADIDTPQQLKDAQHNVYDVSTTLMIGLSTRKSPLT